MSVYPCFFPLPCPLSPVPTILLFRVFFRDVSLNMYNYINIYVCVCVYMFPPQPTATTAISLLEKTIPVKHVPDNCGKEDWPQLPGFLRVCLGGAGTQADACASRSGSAHRAVGKIRHVGPCRAHHVPPWVTPLQENAALLPLPPAD